MGRATEDQLAELHSRVTETMLTALNQSDRASLLLIRYANETVPDEIRNFLKEVKVIPPALLTSATKFLKDNNISCDPAEDQQLSELERRLHNKANSGNVTEIAFTD